MVQYELAAYGAGLAEKPQLLALNKGDLLDAELMEDIAAQLREAGAEEIYSISGATGAGRSEEHTSELQSLMRNSYADFCLKQKKKRNNPLQFKLKYLQ